MLLKKCEVMMIKSIELENFQKYKNREVIEFTNGVNVIHGDSDEGKSTLMRAFRWFFFDFISGHDLMNWYSKSRKMEVTINTEHHRISRIFGKNVNKYVLDNDREFKAVKQGMPDEINEIMDTQHLDELAKLVGESRFEGQKAKGKVTFQVSGDNVQIFEGVTIGTTPDANGEFLSFRVDADGDGEIDEESDASVSPDPGESEVTVE